MDHSRLVGHKVAAAMLRISGARLRQIWDRPDFPATIYIPGSRERFWDSKAIIRFDLKWDRTIRPGRPRKELS